MVYNNENLNALQQLFRKKQLEVTLNDLYVQRNALVQKAANLEAVKADEQHDVDRLEGRSLAAFFYNVVGKMGEKLAKEREEAYAAAVKYDAAVRELTTVEENIRRYEGELGALHGCEEQYAQALREKAASLKASGSTVADGIIGLEERIAYLDSQRRELSEAIAAGEAALSTTDSVLDSLDSAEGWGVFDIMGGGVIADIVKHGHLDDAQGSIEYLQVQLRHFKTELADVTIQADMQVNIDGFLQFADFFFDGLFADWAVMDEINQSQYRVQETRSQICAVLERLETMAHSTAQEQIRTQQELDNLILKTTV